MNVPGSQKETVLTNFNIKALYDRDTDLRKLKERIALNCANEISRIQANFIIKQ